MILSWLWFPAETPFLSWNYLGILRYLASPGSRKEAWIKSKITMICRQTSPSSYQQPVKALTEKPPVYCWLYTIEALLLWSSAEQIGVAYCKPPIPIPGMERAKKFPMFCLWMCQGTCMPQYCMGKGWRNTRSGGALSWLDRKGSIVYLVQCPLPPTTIFHRWSNWLWQFLRNITLVLFGSAVPICFACSNSSNISVIHSNVL